MVEGAALPLADNLALGFTNRISFLHYVGVHVIHIAYIQIKIHLDLFKQMTDRLYSVRVCLKIEAYTKLNHIQGKE